MAAQWLDLVDPTREELLGAIATPLDPEAIEVLASPAEGTHGARPVLEGHGSYVVAVLSHPRVDPVGGSVDYYEVDVVASTSVVATVRKAGPGGRLAPADAVGARAAGGALAGQLVHAVVDDVADALLEVLDNLYERIDALEGDLDSLSGADIRRRAAELRHELLRARKTASATRVIARRIVDGRVDVGRSDLFPASVEAHFVDTYETLVRVTEELDVARDLLAGVRDYYQAKVAEQQNDVSKKLTVIASLVLVPSFIVGFYGQNFAGAFDARFWSLGLSVALILATTIVQLALFRWRRWI